MKQFSIILNVVLLIAVAVLYFLFFTGKRDKHNKAFKGIAGTKESCVFKTPLVAYVELDSLNNNVTFIRDRKKELEAEQKVIAAEYENAYHGLEAEKNNFLKRGNAITQQEAEEFQARL